MTVVQIPNLPIVNPSLSPEALFEIVQAGVSYKTTGYQVADMVVLFGPKLGVKNFSYIMSALQTDISGADTQGKILNYVPESAVVFINGVKQNYTTYDDSNPLQITLSWPSADGDIVDIQTYEKVE